MLSANWRSISSICRNRSASVLPNQSRSIRIPWNLHFLSHNLPVSLRPRLWLSWTRRGLSMRGAGKPHLLSSPRGKEALSFSRLNNAAPNRVMYEFIHRMKPQLKHDSGPVRFDGSGANAQGGRYFLIAFAQREELNDFPLSR